MNKIRIHSFFIRYNFFIAFCSLALLKYTSLRLNVAIPNSVYVLTFFSTLLTYTILRHIHSVKELLNNKNIFLSAFISGSALIVGLFFLFMRETIMLLYASIGLVVFLYKVPFYKHKSLRQLSYVKIFIVAAVWVLIGVVMPVVLNSSSITYKHLFFILSEFLFFIAITIPFDMADKDTDNFKTLPSLLGEKKSILLSIVCVVMYFILNSIIYNRLYEIIICLIFSLITIVTLVGWKYNRSRTYLYYRIDGLIILQLFAAVMSSYIRYKCN